MRLCYAAISENMSRLPKNVASSAVRSFLAKLRFVLILFAPTAPLRIPENQTLDFLLNDSDTGAIPWDSGIAIRDETQR